MPETLQTVAAFISAFGGGFAIGYYVGKNQQPTITEHPHTLCPEMEANIPDGKDWFHSILTFKNGKLTTVTCKALLKKKCTLTGHKCRYLL